MKTNGLIYLNIKSSSSEIKIQSDQDILDKAPENAWFIAYLYHRVVIGKITDGKFDYYPDEKIPNDVTLSNILKLRVFNEDSELFVWKTNIGGYKARLRKDKDKKIIDPDDMKNQLWFDPDKQYAVEAKQVLFGTKAEELANDYTKLKEARGNEIIIPLTNLKIDEKDHRMCIKTRSYIGYIEKTGQATYEDVRFVEFVKYEEEKK